MRDHDRPQYGQSGRSDPRSTESACELREDREIDMEMNTLKSTDAQGEHRPLMLETAELALDRGAALVEGSPRRAIAWDPWVQASRRTVVREQVVTSLHVGRPAQRDHRCAIERLQFGVERLEVVALV